MAENYETALKKITELEKIIKQKDSIIKQKEVIIKRQDDIINDLRTNYFNLKHPKKFV